MRYGERVTSKLQNAETQRADFEKYLRGEVERIFTGLDVEGPWAAVAIAYHHGLAFDCVLGVLPEEDCETDGDPEETLNPAEWDAYDDDGLYVEDDRVTELGKQLEGLGYEDDDPRYAREIYVRVASALRPLLVERKLLSENGIFVVTDYEQCDLKENAAKVNPPDALRRFGLD